MRTHVLLLVVVGIAAVGGAGTVVRADTPQLTVSVDGTPISGGDERRFEQNPPMRIDASAAEGIDSVIVRVNGNTARDFSAGSANFSEEFVVQLEENEANTVRVIVRDAGGDVESIQFVINKDGVPPFVGFDEPFQTQVQSRPPDVTTLSSSAVRFAGTLKDLTGVRTVTIERTHHYERVGEERAVSETYQIQQPGTTFSQDVFLGYGENEVAFTMIDPLGNQRTYDIEFNIRDEQPPNLTVGTPPAVVRAGSVDVPGEVTDNTQIDEVTYQVEGRTGPVTIVSSEGPRVNPDRQSLSFEQRVPLVPGQNTVLIAVTDVAGNTATEEFSVRYNDTVVPQIAIGGVTRENDSVVVRGSIQSGSYRRVTVETVDAASNETLDFRRLYDDEPTGERLALDESLNASASGEIRVVLRVQDANGQEHVQATTVGQAGTASPTGMPVESTTESPGGLDGPTPEDGDETSPDDGNDVEAPATAEPTVESPQSPLLEQVRRTLPVERDDDVMMLLVSSVGLALVSTYLTVKRRRLW